MRIMEDGRKLMRELIRHRVLLSLGLSRAMAALYSRVSTLFGKGSSAHLHLQTGTQHTLLLPLPEKITRQ